MQLLFFSGKGLKEKNELRELSQQGGEEPEQDTLREVRAPLQVSL